jgi:hypothetical protein
LEHEVFGPPVGAYAELVQHQNERARARGLAQGEP